MLVVLEETLEEAIEEALLPTEDITDLTEDDRLFIESLCVG